jgi:1-deoxy-D-xylulose-5-phosphate synthase
MPETGDVLEIGKGRVLQEGHDVAILSFGAHLAEAREAVQELEAKGVSVTLADARFAKPLDTALIDELMAGHRALITVEQGSMLGFGGLVLHHLAASRPAWTGAVRCARCTCPTGSSIRQALRTCMQMRA